jgi:hypothetical protein
LFLGCRFDGTILMRREFGWLAKRINPSETCRVRVPPGAALRLGEHIMDKDRIEGSEKEIIGKIKEAQGALKLILEPIFKAEVRRRVRAQELEVQLLDNSSRVLVRRRVRAQELEAACHRGGLSGSTMERPALKRLLEDIKASKAEVEP